MDLKQLEKNFPPQDLAALTRAIEVAVQRSAKAFPLALSMKDTEVRRRVGWCVGTVLMMRRIMFYTIERICDVLPNALLTYLRYGAWTPNERRMWGAEE
jgi:hypothetical protein